MAFRHWMSIKSVIASRVNAQIARQTENISRFSLCTVSTWGGRERYQPYWESVVQSRTNILAVRQQNSLSLPVSRGYAKGKAKGKDKGGKSKKNTSSVYLSSEELNAVFDFSKLTEQMQQTLTHLKLDYAQQLSLRTSQGAFDKLVVDTPEGQFPLIQLGQVTQKNPQLIVINMGTTPQYTANVKQAIIDSGMNLNPQQDGTSLFVPIPKVTKEHRENLAKNAKTLSEKTKVKVKDIQNKYIKELKKAEKLHSEDLIDNLKTAIQDQAHKYTTEAENIMHAKQQELLGGK